MSQRIWIAKAPAGVWSSGPSVIYHEDDTQGWRDIGWEVTGPYVLEPQPATPETIWWQTMTPYGKVVIDKDPYIDTKAKLYVDGREARITKVSRYRDGGTTPIDFEIDGVERRVTRPSPLHEGRRGRS